MRSPPIPAITIVSIASGGQSSKAPTAKLRLANAAACPLAEQKNVVDILVAFDKIEALRNSGVLAKDGTAVVNDLCLVPVTVSSGQQPPVEDLDGRVKKTFRQLVLVDASAIASGEIGNARTMNMVLAGALSAKCPFPEEVWYAAMADLLSGPKAKLLEVNRRAFAAGRERAIGG